MNILLAINIARKFSRVFTNIDGEELESIAMLALVEACNKVDERCTNLDSWCANLIKARLNDFIRTDGVVIKKDKTKPIKSVELGIQSARNDNPIDKLIFKEFMERLDNRERIVCTLLGRGYKFKEISEETGIPIPTIQGVIERIKVRYGD